MPKKSAAEKIKMRKWFSGDWWYLSKDLGRWRDEPFGYLGEEQGRQR